MATRMRPGGRSRCPNPCRARGHPGRRRTASTSRYWCTTAPCSRTPQLVDAVAAATRIAVTNVRLQAEVLARAEQLAASRRRIVEAADAQRRRLQRELSEGAERRLARVAAHVEALGRRSTGRAPRELLADVEAQLARRPRGAARARARHPPDRADDGGLGAALPELARRAPVPVELRVEPGALARRRSRRPPTSSAPRRWRMSRSTRAPRPRVDRRAARAGASWCDRRRRRAAAPTRRAARACAGSPTASRRSAGGSASRARRARAPGWSPRSPPAVSSAARRRCAATASDQSVRRDLARDGPEREPVAVAGSSGT